MGEGGFLYERLSPSRQTDRQPRHWLVTEGERVNEVSEQNLQEGSAAVLPLGPGEELLHQSAMTRHLDGRNGKIWNVNPGDQGQMA